MNRRTWKAAESEWARWLGGRRVPVTGRGRGDAPDVDHPLYAIEVKVGRVMSDRLRLGIGQAMAAAVGTAKTPLLCITQCSGRGREREHYVLMRLADFQSLMGCEEVE